MQGTDLVQKKKMMMNF